MHLLGHLNRTDKSNSALQAGFPTFRISGCRIEFDMIKSVMPIGLEELRRVDPNFQPPQIYRYITNEDIDNVLSKRIK